MTKQIKRKTLILFMVLSVFMTTICSQTSVKAANKVYKNVKLIFEDNQGNTIKTFTKDITQGETLGQILGDQYPTMKADYKLGNFTGWYSSDCLYGLYSGKRYEKNEEDFCPVIILCDDHGHGCNSQCSNQCKYHSGSESDGNVFI